MGTGIEATLKATMTDPATRHCITCMSALVNINEQPCRTCMHTEPIGRARPLWMPQEMCPECGRWVKIHDESCSKLNKRAPEPEVKVQPKEPQDAPVKKAGGAIKNEGQQCLF